MTLSFNEVQLKRVEEADIEMLRQWRNDKKIAANMFYQEYITAEMQQRWFNSLTDTDYYFIINYRKEAIGLINLKNENHHYFAGLFIYNEKYWGTPLPIYASLALLQFAFERLTLTEVLAKVREENLKAIAYNKSLGFKLVNKITMKINAEDYLSKTHPLIKKFQKKTS